MKTDTNSQLVTFIPFLVDPNDLATGINDNQYRLMLSSDTENGSVPMLQNLYQTYYSREAKTMPIIIERVITVTWLLATNRSGNVQVSRVHVLGLYVINQLFLRLYMLLVRACVPMFACIYAF